jgi:hypothetical protein
VSGEVNVWPVPSAWNTFNERNVGDVSDVPGSTSVVLLRVGVSEVVALRVNVAHSGGVQLL